MRGMRGAVDWFVIAVAVAVTAANVATAEDVASAVVGWSCGFLSGVALPAALVRRWTAAGAKR